MGMRFESLPIVGCYRIDIEPIVDDRGFFARLLCADILREKGLKTHFAQQSISYNRNRGTLRGLHYQAEPHAETKLVRCSYGSAYDVIVDLRRESPTYGTWHALELTHRNHTAVYVPPGCAHGFQTLENDTELFYMITPAYVPGAARGIRYDDPALTINWPIPEPILSKSDQALPYFSAA
jgi:dTDP-4-dehydrorhamnose 3,5-epimerase